MLSQGVRRLLLIGSLASAGPALSVVLAVEAAPAAPPPARASELDWDTGAGKSSIIPGIEIPVFLTALNLYDRAAYGNDVYGTTPRTTWDHLRKEPWEFDDDPFNVNQFSHPYLGATLFGLARTTGHDFWQSLVYSNVGSFTWEMAGERGPPSINDIISTGQAGSLLGESLFRMANLLLETGEKHNGRPGFWRELGAAGLMPAVGLNRLMFGDRFKTIFPSHNPPNYWQIRLGASADSNVSDNGPVTTVKRQEVILDFTMAYGLPGDPTYEYTRPFDYFQFEFAALSSAHTHNWLENVICRGLLWGKRYEAGENYDGVFGVYGSYDFISPQVFRVSSTAVNVGTTAQWWVARHVALQGTVLGGVGFGAAGTNPFRGERDYHYGITPQGLVSLRVIFGERAMFDLTARDYYISGNGSDDTRGSEQIFRGNAGITVRIYGRNALGIQYVSSHRDSHYLSLPSRHQTVGTFSLVYTYLSDRKFGAVGSHD